jgi:hypothetical protein
VTCCACNLQMHTATIGIALEEMTAQGPYKLFSADVLRCPGCGFEIARPATVPLSEHFRQDYPSISLQFRKRNKMVRSWSTVREKQDYQMAQKAAEVTA